MGSMDLCICPVFCNTMLTKKSNLKECHLVYLSCVPICFKSETGFVSKTLCIVH